LKDKIEVWVGEVATGELWRVNATAVADGLNATVGDAVQWMPDSKRLLCQACCGPNGVKRGRRRRSRLSHRPDR